MTAGNTKTPRLLAAAKEFNIGKETLLDFLKGKGFDVSDKPTSKITEEMYDALHKEFAKDKAAKQKSDEIALPKGNTTMVESLTKDETTFESKEKKAKEKSSTKVAKKEVIEKVEAPAPIQEADAAPEEISKPSTPTTEEKEIINASQLEIKEEAQPEPIKEEVKQEKVDEKPTIVEAPIEVKETKEKEKEAEEKPSTPVVEKNEASTIEAKEEAPSNTEDKVEDSNNENTTPVEHIETSSPKLQGPKIINKIDLSEINMQTRPKKAKDNTSNKDKKKVETNTNQKPNKEDAKSIISTPAAENKKEVEAPKKSTPRPQREELRLPHKELITEVTFEPQKPEEEREHIDLNAPKLEGPKILGKIELPVGTQSGRKEKKNANVNAFQ
jgi:translation initiation factor IF-2